MINGQFLRVTDDDRNNSMLSSRLLEVLYTTILDFIQQRRLADARGTLYELHQPLGGMTRNLFVASRIDSLQTFVHAGKGVIAAYKERVDDTIPIHDEVLDALGVELS